MTNVGTLFHMSLDFRFAIISDLHITLPQTIWDHPGRFHLVEVSLPALNHALDHLLEENIDFLLLPGDLTQHGEPANHQWLAERLSQLPFPVYVIPGNHDIPYNQSSERAIMPHDFPALYRRFGYEGIQQLYYCHEILPGVKLIALNSNDYEEDGRLVGRVDPEQLSWLESTLHQVRDEVVLVMIHHNVVEHLWGQSRHPWGQRYIISNASLLLRMLQEAGVQLVFTGHLHIQNIATRRQVFDITTGSLVSYPHPYRLVHFHQDAQGRQHLQIETHRIQSVPEFPDLQHASREWMAQHSSSPVIKFLTAPPIHLPHDQAAEIAPHLRYFWAQIAEGDAVLSFPHLPPQARQVLEKLNRSSILDPQIPVTSDNHTQLTLDPSLS
jgi:3',5'-cyclic AMP phosphodiesterase CpdA